MSLLVASAFKKERDLETSNLTSLAGLKSKKSLIV
jgi:hypothetical protein